MTYEVLLNRQVWVDDAYRMLKKGEIIEDNLLPAAAYKDLVKAQILKKVTEEKPVEETPKPKNKSGRKSLNPATENKAVNPVVEDK